MNISIGRPNSCRAVDQANRRNTVPIIIPFHRVIGKNGEMTGYLGKDLDKKVKLIKLEKTYKDKNIVE